MQRGEKLPVGIKGISRMMKMMPEEVRMCPFFEEVRSIFRDYNYGVLSKDKLIEKLSNIDEGDGRFDIFNKGIENAINMIQVCY